MDNSSSGNDTSASPSSDTSDASTDNSSSGNDTSASPSSDNSDASPGSGGSQAATIGDCTTTSAPGGWDGVASTSVSLE